MVAEEGDIDESDARLHELGKTDEVFDGGADCVVICGYKGRWPYDARWDLVSTTILFDEI